MSFENAAVMLLLIYSICRWSGPIQLLGKELSNEGQQGRIFGAVEEQTRSPIGRGLWLHVYCTKTLLQENFTWIDGLFWMQVKRLLRNWKPL